MDFGVLDGLMSSEIKNSSTSSCDLDLKTKWFGSSGGSCKQESYVSTTTTTTNEDEWRDLKMAKVTENGGISKTMLQQQQQQQQHRSSCGQNMLSFSSPNTQSVTFPYYARNNTGYGAGGLFTPSQWMELEHQALIYKYITANAAIPSNLLIPIKKALESAAFSAYSGGHFRQNTYGWGALHLGFCNSTDPEPGRCRRTDGKKWRCAKDAVHDQKYCERHMNRGRHRSRKPVEAQSSHSLSKNTVVSAAKPTPNPVGSSHDNRKANMEANGVPMLSTSSHSLKKNQHSTPKEVSNTIEFGLVCSDSLVNPMHKSDSRSQHPLHQFMEVWPHSNRAPAPSERQDLSPLRMGLGMSIQVNRVPGGPLGEVLQKSKNDSPTGLNMMTEQLGPTSHKMQLGYLL